MPQYLGSGVVVANLADSGESSQSYLDAPVFFDALEARLAPGDVVLLQFGHNDKTTTAEAYRANLTEMVERVRAAGAEPVLVSPVARRRYTRDGTDGAGTPSRPRDAARHPAVSAATSSVAQAGSVTGRSVASDAPGGVTEIPV